MTEIITLLLYIVLSAFASRTIAHMLMYGFTYGQFLGWFKLWIARKIDAELVDSFIDQTHSVSYGQEQESTMYDILCNANGFWAFLLSLMDCVFCTGFWVSVAISLVVILSFGLTWWLIIAIPVLTFFFIEKI